MKPIDLTNVIDFPLDCCSGGGGGTEDNVARSLANEALSENVVQDTSLSILNSEVALLNPTNIDSAIDSLAIVDSALDSAIDSLASTVENYTE